MNYIIKRIEIDLYSPTSYEVIKAQQGDNKSRIIEFVLLDKGEPYHISDNIKINLEGCRGDHSGFIKENFCQVSDNIISVALDSDILYAPGTVEAKIVMYDNGSILSTIPFKISVQQNPRDKENIEKDKKSVLDDLVNKLDNLSETVKKNMNDDKIQENTINFLANNTYKNLLRNSAVTKTVNGVTFTVNPDKSVTVNGTATADTTFLIGSFSFDNDKHASYEYTGTPANGSNTTYYTELKHCRISGGYSEYYNEYGKGIYLVNNDYYAYVVVNLKIMNGYTADNLIFYPMIRLSSISDKSYVPYNSAPVEIGDTAELVTNSKTNVVSAINEVNNSITTTKSTLEEHKNDTVHHIGAHERDAWNQAQTDISNLVVGGRNLLQASKEVRTEYSFQKIIYNFGDTSPIAGETYTIGFHVDFLTTDSDGTIKIYNVVTDPATLQNEIVLGASLNIHITLPDENGYYWTQFIWSLKTPTGVMISAPVTSTPSGDPILTIKNVILTKGKNIKADWNYAPEDIDNLISHQKDSIDSIYNSIEMINTNIYGTPDIAGNINTGLIYDVEKLKGNMYDSDDEDAIVPKLKKDVLKLQSDITNSSRFKFVDFINNFEDVVDIEIVRFYIDIPFNFAKCQDDFQNITYFSFSKSPIVELSNKNFKKIIILEQSVAKNGDNPFFCTVTTADFDKNDNGDFEIYGMGIAYNHKSSLNFSSNLNILSRIYLTVLAIKE